MPPEWFSVHQHVFLPHAFALNRHSGGILVRNPANLGTLAAFLTGSQEVAGSIPVSSTICFPSFALGIEQFACFPLLGSIYPN